jgi:thioredoxin-like negative regulator of GroEL
MAVGTVSDREFGPQVLQQDAPVVVAFRAAWCAPSQQQLSMLDDVAARFDGRVKVVAVDVDDPKANKLCRQYRVTRLPVVMVFRGGRVADLVGGAASPEVIADMIERQSRPVIDVDEYSFEAEVLKAQVPVLVHVDAAWCAQSQSLLPVVEETAQRFRGRAKVVRLEYGPANARLCAQYGFLRVPTLAVFNRGQVEDQILGPMRGGTKTDQVSTSCVGLTATNNVGQMLEQFVP